MNTNKKHEELKKRINYILICVHLLLDAREVPLHVGEELARLPPRALLAHHLLDADVVHVLQVGVREALCRGDTGSSLQSEAVCRGDARTPLQRLLLTTRLCLSLLLLYQHILQSRVWLDWDLDVV